MNFLSISPTYFSFNLFCPSLFTEKWLQQTHTKLWLHHTWLHDENLKQCCFWNVQKDTSRVPRLLSKYLCCKTWEWIQIDILCIHNSLWQSTEKQSNNLNRTNKYSHPAVFTLIHSFLKWERAYWRSGCYHFFCFFNVLFYLFEIFTYSCTPCVETAVSFSCWWKGGPLILQFNVKLFKVFSRNYGWMFTTNNFGRTGKELQKGMPTSLDQYA